MTQRRLTRLEVLALRSGTADGCCDRFADQKSCDCLENAAPDDDAAKRVPAEAWDAPLRRPAESIHEAIRIELIRSATEVVTHECEDQDLFDEAAEFLIRCFKTPQR